MDYIVDICMYNSVSISQVIVRREGKILLLCKGADTTVNAKLDQSSDDILSITKTHLNVSHT